MEEVINVGMNRINKTPAAVKVTANGSLKGNKKSKHAASVHLRVSAFLRE